MKLASDRNHMVFCSSSRLRPFGTSIAFNQAESKPRVLKLSVKNDPDALHIIVEGRVVHPWTEELEKLMHQTVSHLASKRLFLNLCGTTFVDRNGMRILRKIVQTHNPIILADSPLTRQFAEQATQVER
jgi:hypothetical protein